MVRLPDARSSRRRALERARPGARQRLPVGQELELSPALHRRLSRARIVLLTGRPGVGKTTCLQRTLAVLATAAGGFFTEEIRAGGKRVGFALVTLDGERAVLAHVDRAGGPRVGPYGVNLDALDRVGAPALREAIGRRHLVVIDEIGKMEMCAPAFRAVIDEALQSPVTVLGTILAAPHHWADTIKAHPAVRLIEVTPANRDALPDALTRLLGGGTARPRRRLPS